MDLTVKIPILPNELLAACEAFADLPNYTVYTRESKVTKSVLDLVAVKLLKKQFSKLKDNKPFNLKLEFFEAHTLEKYLLMHNETCNDYNIQRLIDKLNQKLA